MLIIYILRFLFGWAFMLFILLIALIYRIISWDFSGDFDCNQITDMLLGEKTLNAMFFGKPDRYYKND